MRRDRTLAWDGCVNVRDLGGLPTETGAVTALGRIVRADSVRQLSDEGWQSAADYGIRTVVDLRFREELDADPPDDVPLDVKHVSLLGDPDPAHWEELERRAAALGDDEAATAMVYLDALERHRERFVIAVDVVADAPAGGVLIHCAGGKDRTGLLAALLLRLAGVPTEEVAADYAQSEVHLAERHEAWFDAAVDDAERERLRRIARTPHASMAEVVTRLERQYGSTAGYLRSGGADDATLERARARLLD